MGFYQQEEDHHQEEAYSKQAIQNWHPLQRAEAKVRESRGGAQESTLYRRVSILFEGSHGTSLFE